MAEPQRHDEDLGEEEFDMAATRPELLGGIPYSMAGSLIFVGYMFYLGYNPADQVKGLIGDAIVLGAVVMLWFTARTLLQSDYHGWDNFIAWVRLDFFCLDTNEWGGARIASFPLRSNYRCGALDV